jgi:hypothetical protein
MGNELIATVKFYSTKRTQQVKPFYLLKRYTELVEVLSERIVL